MTKKIEDKSNENRGITELIPIIPKKDDETLPVAESMEDKFIRNLFLYESKYKAAIKAGYTENTAKSTIYTKLKSERFRDKIRSFTVANDLAEIPIIAHIERKILKAVNKDIKQYPKFKDVFRQKKQIAGILGDDTSPPPTTINIESIQKLQIMVGDMLRKKLQDSDTKQTPHATADINNTEYKGARDY